MFETAEIKPLEYVPALDGVRGVFCLLIITHHWVMPYLQGPFALLWWILQLFFVLSAYLITKILIYDKNRLSPRHLLKKFYTRRALRIFPLYFLYIFLIGGLLLLAGTTPTGATNHDVIYFKENWGFLLTYTYNFAEIANYFRGVNFIPAPLFSHLWSLSLEEQFYFIFPLIITLMPLKYFKYAVIGLILLAPAIRGIAYHIFANINPDREWLGLIAFRNTIFQMDSLAYGMAIAIFDIEKIKKPLRLFIVILTIWFIYTFTSGYFIMDSGHAASVWSAIKEYLFMTYHYNYIFLFTLSNIMCATFVIALIRNQALAKIFSGKFVVYLGKISYSMYVWHYVGMILTAGILTLFIGDIKKYFGNFFIELGIFIFYMSVVIFISHLSYKYFEMYFVKLKNKV